MPIARVPFTFILAPHYHPAMAMIAPYRKALPFRTMFNVLGPLINPAFPKGMLVGVAEPELGRTYAESLRTGGVERAIVVEQHGHVTRKDREDRGGGAVSSLVCVGEGVERGGSREGFWRWH